MRAAARTSCDYMRSVLSIIMMILTAVKRVSRQAKELVMMNVILLLMVLMMVLRTAVEVNILIYCSLSKSEFLTLIWGLKFEF